LPQNGQMPPPVPSIADPWLDPATLARSVSPAALTAGWRYVRQGRVLGAQLVADGQVLEGTTRGSSPKPYRQVIRLRRAGRGPVTVDGLCTCPVGYNCKHVAAVLLRHAEARPKAPSPPPLTEPTLPPALAQWLAALPEPGAAPPPAPRDQVIYLLDIAEQAGRPGALVVTPMVQALRKDGSGGAVRRFRLQSPSASPRYVTAADRTIIRRLPA